MGISVEEYLAKKQACADCITHGEEDHCVSTMLSREDNCVIYNAIWAYHIPNREKNVSFTPDERNRMSTAAINEAELFTSLRDKIDPDTVLEYYTRSQKVVTMIKAVHKNDRAVWAGYYQRFMPKILDHLRNGRDADAMAEILIMIETLEETNGRVICTWLTGKGLMAQHDLNMDRMFTIKNIKDTTRIGYLLWAIPMVEKLESMARRNGLLDRMAIRIVQKLAQARADEIKYCMGHVSKGNTTGKIVRFVGENICYLLGSIVELTSSKKINHKIG